MKYIELYAEYISLTTEKYQTLSQMQQLCFGYISTKTIRGKKHHYLQHRENGKMKSEYVNLNELDRVNSQLVQRAKLQARLKEIEKSLIRIEAGVKIISPTLSQRLWFYKQGAATDSLTLDERKESMAFTEAITALEGLPSSQGLDDFLLGWVDGKGSFVDFYLSLLEQYNIIERSAPR